MNREAIKRKWKSKKGFSLAEMLLAVLLLLIASQGMVQGITFVSKHFSGELENSESAILFSTLKETINYELANTRGTLVVEKAEKSGDWLVYPVSRFYSVSFNSKDTRTGFRVLDEHGDPVEEGGGYLALGGDVNGSFVGKYILNKSVYVQGLTAQIRDFKYYKRDDLSFFQYTLLIYNQDGEEIMSDTIEVMPMNDNLSLSHE